MRGFTENFDWIRKDLEFVKKGYKGIFELASSFSEKSSQAQCGRTRYFIIKIFNSEEILGSNSGVSARGVSSGFKSIQSSMYEVKGSIEALQSRSV